MREDESSLFQQNMNSKMLSVINSTEIISGKALALQLDISNRTVAVTFNERRNLTQQQIYDRQWTLLT